MCHAVVERWVRVERVQGEKGKEEVPRNRTGEQRSSARGRARSWAWECLVRLGAPAHAEGLAVGTGEHSLEGC